MSKTIKILTIINIVFVAGAYIFCFWVEPDDISGACIECSGSGLETLLGKMFLVIELILMLMMYFAAKKLDYVKKISTLITCAGANMFLGLIQMMIIFKRAPHVISHEYEFGEKELNQIKMMSVQYDAGRIISGIIMAICMAVMIMSVIYVNGKENKE